MDVKNRSIEKIVKGTGILIFGLEGPRPKATLLDKDEKVTSCTRDLSHPDICIRLTMAHRVSSCEGGRPFGLRRSSDGVRNGRLLVCYNVPFRPLIYSARASSVSMIPQSTTATSASIVRP